MSTRILWFCLISDGQILFSLRMKNKEQATNLKRNYTNTKAAYAMSSSNTRHFAIIRKLINSSPLAGTLSNINYQLNIIYSQPFIFTNTLPYLANLKIKKQRPEIRENSRNSQLVDSQACNKTTLSTP